MEKGSLLSEALLQMQHLREAEDEHIQLKNVNEYPKDAPCGESDNLGLSHSGTKSIILSLFSISREHQPHQDKDVVMHKDHRRQSLHLTLARAHSIIHNELLPRYRKCYAHAWQTGGSGPTFGLHIHPTDSESDLPVPHLRAVVRYGSLTIDVYHALAIVYLLTKDLYSEYDLNFACECWDIDEGQVLLVEGADFLPEWVEDKVGVIGMRHRVYVVQGDLVLIPPKCKFGSDWNLSRLVALKLLAERKDIERSLINTRDGSMTHNPDWTHPPLSKMLLSRLRVHLSILTVKESDDQQRLKQRNLMSDDWHVAAVTVPLSVALMLRYRLDIVPCAISMFCQMAPSLQRSRYRPSKKSENAHTNSATIPFENLVSIALTLPKTMYAMLLTGAGLVPPPMKIPKGYSSFEVRRWKRNNLHGTEDKQKFRHALEVGMRLTLGLEWILQGYGESEDTSRTKSFSAEERVSKFHVRADVNSGGNGSWIRKAWEAGPGAVSKYQGSDVWKEGNPIDITNLVKCPVWDPEILKGGMCPLTHQGKSHRMHIKDTYRQAQKQIDENGSCYFPSLLTEDVDSDHWVDFHSFEALEIKMHEIMNGKSDNTLKWNEKSTGKTVEDVQAVVNLLEYFVDGKSDVRGITTDTAGSAERDEVNVDSTSFVHVLRTVLKSKEEIFTIGHIVDSSGRKDEELDRDLLRLFSKDDLDLDHSHSFDEGQTSSETIREMMGAMDEELMQSENIERYGSDSRGVLSSSIGALPGEVSLDDPNIITADIVSNLVESLDSQNGGTGPTTTLLTEMGMTLLDI